MFNNINLVGPMSWPFTNFLVQAMLFTDYKLNQ